MKQVFLISCVKSKRTDKSACRAEEMYISPLYRASLSHALSFAEDKSGQVFILSALYGLLALDDTIDYYEKTLGNMSGSERARWGARVGESLAERFDLEATHFVFLAGEKYVTSLRKYLKHYNEPLQDLRGIGTRIRWLNEHARGGQGTATSMAAAKPVTPAAPRTTGAQAQFADALKAQMAKARDRGDASLTMTSGELHRLVGGYPGPGHRMPICCNAMYGAMGEGDIIVAKPPSGKGASLKITYMLHPEASAVPLPSSPSEPPQSPPTVFVTARALRSAEALNRVPDDKPGWYRWWAPGRVVSALLSSSHLTEDYVKALGVSSQ